jgi:hypothetical protein
LKNYLSSNFFFWKFWILLSWPLFSSLGGLKWQCTNWKYCAHVYMKVFVILWWRQLEILCSCLHEFFCHIMVAIVLVYFVSYVTTWICYGWTQGWEENAEVITIWRISIVIGNTLANERTFLYNTLQNPI